MYLGSHDVSVELPIVKEKSSQDGGATMMYGNERGNSRNIEVEVESDSILTRKDFRDKEIFKELNSSLITVPIVEDPYGSKCVLGNGSILDGVCFDLVAPLVPK